MQVFSQDAKPELQGIEYRLSLFGVSIKFSPSGVRQGGGRGGPPPGQEAAEAQVPLRPGGRLHLRLRGRLGLPFPAAAAVVGAVWAHGRRRGRQRPSRPLEARRLFQKSSEEDRRTNLISAITRSPLAPAALGRKAANRHLKPHYSDCASDASSASVTEHSSCLSVSMTHTPSLFLSTFHICCSLNGNEWLETELLYYYHVFSFSQLNSLYL